MHVYQRFLLSARTRRLRLKPQCNELIMASKNNPSELLDLLNEKIKEAEDLVKKCDLLIEKQVDGSAKFKRKVQAELDFLNQFNQRPATLRPNHVISTNLTHLNALFEAAISQNKVVAVLAPFERQDEKRTNLLVDVVGDGGSSWIKVVARSARGIHFTWAGEAGYQERGILDQAKDYCTTAQKNPHMYKPPKVIFLFTSGVTQPIVDDLKRRFQIESRGDVVPVDPSWGLVDGDDESEDDDGSEDGSEESGDGSEEDEEKESTLVPEDLEESHISPSSLTDRDIPINLDITAFINYVSALTNGNGAHYRFKEPLLDEQATWERQRPALPWMRQFMDAQSGRQLICCKTALESFMEILNTVGGPEEKQRADELLKRVKVMDDRVSERSSKLQVGGKIKARSKVIFGSGDHYQAVTLTANRGFVHAAANQGIRFAVIFHESRALSEQKQQHAVPLDDSSLACQNDSKTSA